MVWPGASYFHSLSLSFLTGKIWRIITTSLGFLICRITITSLGFLILGFWYFDISTFYLCNKKSWFSYDNTLLTSSMYLSPHTVFLPPTKISDPPQARLSALLPISLLHIQGHYFRNTALLYPPLHHHFFFSFSTKTVSSAYKISLYCYFSHLNKKQTNSFLWFSLPSQWLTYFFAPLCSKILARVILIHCLQFSF